MTPDGHQEPAIARVPAAAGGSLRADLLKDGLPIPFFFLTAAGPTCTRCKGAREPCLQHGFSLTDPPRAISRDRRSLAAFRRLMIFCRSVPSRHAMQESVRGKCCHNTANLS